jgi:hypothetical protein
MSNKKVQIHICSYDEMLEIPTIGRAIANGQFRNLQKYVNSSVGVDSVKSSSTQHIQNLQYSDRITFNFSVLV